MTLNRTLAAQAIVALLGPGMILNRDNKAKPEARCQVWHEHEGKFNLLATGRTWLLLVNKLRNKAANKHG